MNISIQQSTQSIETVTRSIISALYNIAFNAGQGDTISYEGSLYSATAYTKEVFWLQEHFPNLIINVPQNGLYVSFESSATEQVLANKIGDGQGVPYYIATMISSLPTGLGGIDRFLELSTFTYVHTIPLNAFNNNRQTKNNTLQAIDLKNITDIGGNTNQNGQITPSAFDNCKSLSYLGDTSNITHIGTYAFRDCTAFDNTEWYIFPSAQVTGTSPFMGSNIRKIVLGENLTVVSTLLTDDRNPASMVVLLAKTPPQLANGQSYDDYTGGARWNVLRRYKIYVPDEAWTDYIQDEEWGKLISADYIGDSPSNLFKISELPNEEKVALRAKGLDI